ncbi:phosphate butyryltransferase [candidate division KSB3 bacterium]|uniref:Phosphate butyryltransferase n=1 Tax=candidate division KSB3 bacterium TaxID=2044937 RepID=A0A9D5Q447_9BACT|nr:phosphate butyryltransferase [candidate division KSB3 bacterium]MBD3323339.1 phosphate butyryltransferase [candidate division KSB3 bacterium]
MMRQRISFIPIPGNRRRVMDPITNFYTILDCIKGQEKKTVIVAAADEHDVLAATIHARREGLAEFLYVGHADRIRQVAKDYDVDIRGIEIVNELEPMDAAQHAIDLIKQGHGQVLMKGNINTSQILGMVVSDEELKHQFKHPFLSHVTVYEWGNRLRIFSDAGMNIAPDIAQKKKIALNALHIAHKLGVASPRLAFISAVEKVNTKMQSSVDAAILADMAWNGAIVDGPLAFDGAMFEEAYQIKGAPSSIEGKADILIFPNIETANVFYKTLAWMLNLHMAGVMAGSAIPFILTSRSDNERIKFLSIAITLYLAEE